MAAHSSGPSRARVPPSGRTPTLGAVADLKPAYLVHGDDDAKIDQWRGRVRKRAEAEHGPGALEHFHAASAAPEEVVASVLALTFATGTRYILAEEVNSWKAPALEPLVDALQALPPDTVLVLIARGKAPAALAKAVAGAGGEVREHAAPKPWEMPKWVVARAREHGLQMDAEAARMLVALAGPRQQRLVREIEKIAIGLYPETSAGAEDVELLAAGDSAPKVYDLADAVVAGNVELTITLAQELAANDERPSRFVYPIVNRVREVHRLIELLDAGVGEKDLAKAVGGPPWRLKKAAALARKADREVLRQTLCRFAELEVELRGGGTLDEDTAVTLALAGTAR